MYAGLLSLLEHHLKTEVRTRLFLHYVCAASFRLELISDRTYLPEQIDISARDPVLNSIVWINLSWEDIWLGKRGGARGLRPMFGS